MFLNCTVSFNFCELYIVSFVKHAVLISHIIKLTYYLVCQIIISFDVEMTTTIRYLCNLDYISDSSR